MKSDMNGRLDSPGLPVTDIRNVVHRMKSNGYRALVIANCIGMLLVLLAGALVTNTESGAGCGTDWPLCNGKFIPAKTLESAIEYSHRLVSGIVGLIAAATFFVTWRLYKRNNMKDAEPMWYAGGTLFFTIVQAFMGAAAVVWSQSSAVMALHFGISLFAFACTLLLVIWLYRYRRSADMSLSVPATFFPRILMTSLYSLVVIYLGAFIRHTDSAGGCGTSWPLCNGAFVPELEGATAVAFVHRLSAVLFLILIVLMNVHIRRAQGVNRGLVSSAKWTLWLTLAQILSGALVTWTVDNEDVYIFTSLIHNVIICGLFGLLADLCIRSWKYREGRKA